MHQCEQTNDEIGQFDGDNWCEVLQEPPFTDENHETGEMESDWLQPPNSFMDTFSSLSDIRRREYECTDWFNETFN